jgi:hypothetical protein
VVRVPPALTKLRPSDVETAASSPLRSERTAALLGMALASAS